MNLRQTLGAFLSIQFAVWMALWLGAILALTIGAESLGAPTGIVVVVAMAAGGALDDVCDTLADAYIAENEVTDQ